MLMLLLLMLLMLLIYTLPRRLGLVIKGKANPMFADFFHEKPYLCKGGGLLVFLFPVFYLVLLK